MSQCKNLNGPKNKLNIIIKYNFLFVGEMWSRHVLGKLHEILSKMVAWSVRPIETVHGDHFQSFEQNSPSRLVFKTRCPVTYFHNPLSGSKAPCALEMVLSLRDQPHPLFLNRIMWVYAHCLHPIGFHWVMSSRESPRHQVVRCELNDLMVFCWIVHLHERWYKPPGLAQYIHFDRRSSLVLW